MGLIGRSVRSDRGRRSAHGLAIALFLLLLLSGPGGTAGAPAPGATPAAGPATSLVANASYLVGAGNWNCGQGHQTIDFFGTAQGGTPPYEYNWSFGDGTSLSEIQDPAHTYTAPGGFVVNLTVTDAAGQIARANVTPLWGIPLLCGGQPSPFSPMAAILFVGLVGVVVVAGVVVVRWRRPPRPLP